MDIYTVEDLAKDLLEFYNRYHKREVEYDELALWIYRKHNKKFSLGTILRKLSRAKRNRLLTFIQAKEEFDGYKLKKKARVIININYCKAFLEKEKIRTLW